MVYTLGMPNPFFATKEGQKALRRAVVKRRARDARRFPLLAEHNRLERLREWAQTHGTSGLSTADIEALGLVSSSAGHRR